jgi:hypothetical protein
MCSSASAALARPLLPPVEECGELSHQKGIEVTHLDEALVKDLS